MTVTEFYIVQNGEVVPLPKEDFAIIEFWNQKVELGRSKREKVRKILRAHEVLQIITYPQAIKVGPYAMPKQKQYGKSGAVIEIIEGIARDKKAREHPETIPLLDLPRPFRYE